MDRNQAEDISEAILDRERERLGKSKQRSFWRGGYGAVQRRRQVFGVIGFGFGAAVGLFCNEDWMPLAFAGMGLGFILAWTSVWFAKSFNKSL